MNTAAMNRPTTPNFNFAQRPGPSSPPETPTTSTFTFKNRRHGMHFLQPIPAQNGTITPNGKDPTFNYHPSLQSADLSPRSSSPDSTHSSSSGSPPRSRSPSSEPGEPVPESPPPRTRTRIVAEGNFTVEEFCESDYEDFDSENEEHIIRPYQYEDAESEDKPTRPVKPGNELDPGVLNGIRNLHCATEDSNEDHRDAWYKAMKEERRRKRRSSGSVQKRTISQSIGSDTDDEDLQPMQVDANEAGSSARRLRRKVGERISLTFDDPPARIEELEEPESCEEVVAVDDEDEEENEDGQGVDRELPYYMQMDTDED
jgi:hypothetical protein